MKKFIIVLTCVGLAACTTKNDVAIQAAHAQARTQECNAVASIAQSGAASEAAVLLAARGCGAGPPPATGADRAAQIIAATAPIAGALINGAVSVERSRIAAGTQRDTIAATTARAEIDAGVLTTLGQDQVVTVRPEVVTVQPEVITPPAPEVVQLPGPEIVRVPGQPQICAPGADGVLVCQ